MPTDLGTRKGVRVADVSNGSVWQEGYPWMRMDIEKFPIKTYLEIKQACKEASEQSNEIVKKSINAVCHNSHIMVNLEESAKRYEFSHYVIDPNKFRFQKVIRVLALVYRFVRNCKE